MQACGSEAPVAVSPRCRVRPDQRQVSETIHGSVKPAPSETASAPYAARPGSAGTGGKALWEWETGITARQFHQVCLSKFWTNEHFGKQSPEIEWLLIFRGILIQTSFRVCVYSETPESNFLLTWITPTRSSTVFMPFIQQLTTAYLAFAFLPIYYHIINIIIITFLLIMW